MATAKVIFLSILILMTLSLTAISIADPPKKPANDSAGLDRSAPLDKGDIEAQFWGNLDEKEQSETVKSLKQIESKASDVVNHRLFLQETPFFIVYTDAGQNEALRSSMLLDRMYARLSILFGLQKGQNIWHGKALVFIFNRIEDYHLYEQLVEMNDPGGSFAMTHCFGDGTVHIAYYRYPSQIDFDHLLVHESVHGFLHRYRTPKRIPSWVNEGLADELASELIPDPNRAQRIMPLVKDGFAKHKNSTGDFFTAAHIDGWQYPLAESLTAWTIRRDAQGYLDFLNGIKDGEAWGKSLQDHFKLTPEKLVAEYAKANGLKQVKL